jgi:DNA polymerase V
MKRTPFFALIDCNNFFVSCERLFRPDLEGRPVVVLSSNDGCAVSRSAEAKELGIPMGAPAFKYRDLFERHHVVSFSANFELYGNISRRITALLTSITPNIEIYSVDESFLDLSSLPITDYEEWGKQLRQLILDWVGIPVSIGIAPSKTLAKLANLRAKKEAELGGVLSFVKNPGNSGVAQFDVEKSHNHMAKTAAGDIWGIGWRLAPKVRGSGLGNALDIANAQPRYVQQLMGIHGRQLVAELNGISCFPLELEGKLPKSISVTRTFGEDTRDSAVVEAAIASFATRGAFKLRRSRQLTCRVSMFATTNKHKPGYATWFREVRFNQPTADTETLIKTSTQLFRDIYQPAISYHRAGILLHDFVPDWQLQTDLLGITDVDAHDKSKQRMLAIDDINNKYGAHKIHYAAEDIAVKWQPLRKLRSPRYVSQWEDLPILKLMP